MKLLTIGLRHSDDSDRSLNVEIEAVCANLAYKGYKVAVHNEVKGSYQFISCHVNEGELSFRNYERVKRLVKQEITALLARYIVTVAEQPLLQRMIERRYEYFSSSERQSLLQKVLKRIEVPTTADTSYPSTVRFQYIADKMTEYLEYGHDLILEGFMHFRLKPYYEKLAQVIDRTVDDFMMELEYQEFIRVLRYFVESQQPKHEEIHVIVLENQHFQILNEAGESLEETFLDMVGDTGAMNDQDALISALVTLAPYTVMIHFAGALANFEIISTIQSVFEGRVILCDGCSLCRPSRGNH
ncbi:MAG: putative sporulation protein YtxC [Sporomusaceae bacterium]|nr:putative sporulation protein YtxC [Sporomusaceae bacterium]